MTNAPTRMMHAALSFFAELDAGDAKWLLDNGRERRVTEGETVLEEGVAPDDLFVILEGVFEVRSAGSQDDAMLAQLGPGELLGEISFLEDTVASATVRSAEQALLLAIPRASLLARLSEDAEFSARLYRAFGRMLSRRLRERSAALAAERGATNHPPHKRTAQWLALEPVVAGFKDLMRKAEDSTKRGREVADDIVAAAHGGLDQLCRALDTSIGDRSGTETRLRDEIGAAIQLEVHPYLLLTRALERIYSKPRGYAGDFLTIKWIYENDPGGVDPIGPLIDTAFLERPAAQAVRNRRALLADEIRKSVQQADGTARVTTLACGPAEEIFDVFAEPELTDRLSATLIDIDFQALALVADRRDKLRLQKKLRLEQENLVYLAMGRDALDLPPQDLVYSIGLIDYFQDKFVIALLDWIHDNLRPGGKAILGNFHPSNPDKALMDYVLDWRLFHRDEDDMNRLFAASKFAAPCSEIRFEEAGVNLFAAGVKA